MTTGDLFVRWKSLANQPMGGDPDIDDGIRINIRPFLTARVLEGRGKRACVLRISPRMHWNKERGKDIEEPRGQFPWLWNWNESDSDFAGGKEFDGNRWNDLHYTRAAKLAARERAKGGR